MIAIHMANTMPLSETRPSSTKKCCYLTKKIRGTLKLQIWDISNSSYHRCPRIKTMKASSATRKNLLKRVTSYPNRHQRTSYTGRLWKTWIYHISTTLKEDSSRLIKKNKGCSPGQYLSSRESCHSTLIHCRQISVG